MTQTSILERPFVDTAPDVPRPPAAVPAHRAGFRRGARRWRNRAIVALMVAAAAFGTVRLIHHQAAPVVKLTVADVVLTSRPIEVESAQSGVVRSVTVRAGDHVVTGERVGAVDVTTMNTKGRTVVVQRYLRAPSNGVVVSDPLSVGSTLTSGSSFLEMYDPSALTLVTTVPLSYLSKLSPGMSADLTAPGVSGTVHATLQRAVPRLSDNSAGVPADSVQLVFIPKQQATIATLIPGLRFHGSVDIRTATSGSRSAAYVGSS